jgi:hypothetical protein
MTYRESAGAIGRGKSSIQDKARIVFLHISEITHIFFLTYVSYAAAHVTHALTLDRAVTF